MQFIERTFTKRHQPVECAIFIEYDLPAVKQRRGTAAALILPDGRYWIGVTVCAPMDQFRSVVGRARAEGLAYQAFRSMPGPHGQLDLSRPGKEWAAELREHMHDEMRLYRVATTMVRGEAVQSYVGDPA